MNELTTGENLEAILLANTGALVLMACATSEEKEESVGEVGGELPVVDFRLIDTFDLLGERLAMWLRANVVFHLGNSLSRSENQDRRVKKEEKGKRTGKNR